MKHKALRIVIAADEGKTIEDVTFTEDMWIPAHEFCVPGITKLVSDTVVDINLPDAFPLEVTLRKED